MVNNESTTDEVVLSVIITPVGGPRFVRRCLQSLVPQMNGLQVEVIVPLDSTAIGYDALRAEFPAVCFADMGMVPTDAPPGTESAAHEMYDRRTAKGLNVARGRIVALLQDYGAPAADWVVQVVEAHRLPHGVIGGAVEHAGRGGWNWSVYFLDFGRYQLPLVEGPSEYLTDVNVSYKRDVLEAVRPLWQARYKEVTVNWELTRRGAMLWQRPQVVVYQDRGDELTLSRLAVERYHWGRLFGAIRTREISLAKRLLYVAFGAGIPLVLVARMARRVFGGRSNVVPFLRYFPQFVVLTWLWCVGEMVGYVTGRESTR